MNNKNINRGNFLRDFFESEKDYGKIKKEIRKENTLDIVNEAKNIQEKQIDTLGVWMCKCR